MDNVQPPTWAWARSAMGSSSGWTPIIDATNGTYEPTGDDRERYLRVTASYNDGHGQGRKTLSATSEFATAATRASNMPPMFPDPLFTGVQTGLSVRENAGVRTVVGVAPEATDMQERRAQVLPRGLGLHQRSAVRDQSHLKADPGRPRRTRSRGPGQLQRHGDGGGRIRRHRHGHLRHHHSRCQRPARGGRGLSDDPGGHGRYLRRPRERH